MRMKLSESEQWREPADSDEEPLCLGIDPSSRRLGVGRSTIYELIKAGKLRTVTIGTRRLIPVAELRAYVERLLVESAGDDAA